MGYGAVLVENLLSRTQFPLHALQATEEAAGKPVERIASGRRASLYYWTSITANLQQDITGSFDRLRGFDMLALDRNNNLGGKTCELHASAISDFSSFETVLSITIPTVTTPGSLDDGLGVRSEEGAFFIRFPLRTARYIRWRIPAAAAYKPQVGGLYIGKSWTLPGLEEPWSEDANDQIGQLAESSVGWQARVDPGQRRSGALRMKLGGLTHYDLARYHIGGHFAAGRPMWITFDDQQAERSFFAMRDGRIAWSYAGGWGYRQADIGYVEHGALPA